MHNIIANGAHKASPISDQGTNKHILLPTMFMVSWTQAVWKEGASAETSQLYTPAASSSRLVRATWVALLSLFCNKDPTPRFSQPCIGGCFFPDGFARVTTPPFQPRVLFLAAFLKLGGTEVSFGKDIQGIVSEGDVFIFEGVVPCRIKDLTGRKLLRILQRALFFFLRYFERSYYLRGNTWLFAKFFFW